MRISMLALAAVLGCAGGQALAQPLILTVQAQPQTSEQGVAQAPEQTAPSHEPAQIQDRDESQGTSRAQTQDQAHDQIRRQDRRSAIARGRYHFKRVDDGFLRLDSESGHIVFCRPHRNGWACQAVPEDRAALEKEITRLHDEVSALKKEIATLRALPPPPRPPADVRPSPGNGGGLPLPSDQDVARARTAVEHVWRQLMDMLANMQKDMMRKVQPDHTTL